MNACSCESSLCDHGNESCQREGTTPAPVQYLYGELMCPHCIGHYIAEGYGVNVDGSKMSTDSLYARHLRGENI